MITNVPFTLHSLPREEAHCDVYSVIRHDAENVEPAFAPELNESKPDSSFEARVYRLDKSVPVKLRKYRLKGIKRLESRTVKSFSLSDGLQLVVYRTGQLDSSSSEPSEQPGNRESLKKDLAIPTKKGSAEAPSQPGKSKLRGGVEASEGKSNIEEVSFGAKEPPVCNAKRARPAKTFRRKISARISQRARRQVNRKERKDAKSSHHTCIKDNSVLWIPLFLYLTRQKDGRLREQIPKNGEEIILQWAGYDAGIARLGRVLLQHAPQYLTTAATLRFLNADEMEEYILTKRQEIISLEKLQRMLPKIEEDYARRSASFDDLQLASYAAKHEWWEDEKKRRAAFQRHLVVQHAVKALPGVIEDGKNTSTSMLSRLEVIRKKEAELKRIDCLMVRKELLDKELGADMKWCESVVPLSTPFGHLERRLNGKTETLGHLRMRKDALENTLQSLLVAVIR